MNILNLFTCCIKKPKRKNAMVPVTMHPSFRRVSDTSTMNKPSVEDDSQSSQPPAPPPTPVA